MQVQVTSRDEIKVTVNANELALMDYALSYFASCITGNPRFPASDAIRAQQLADQLFDAYTVVIDDQAEAA